MHRLYPFTLIYLFVVGFFAIATAAFLSSNNHIYCTWLRCTLKQFYNRQQEVSRYLLLYWNEDFKIFLQSDQTSCCNSLNSDTDIACINRTFYFSQRTPKKIKFYCCKTGKSIHIAFIEVNHCTKTKTTYY